MELVIEDRLIQRYWNRETIKE